MLELPAHWLKALGHSVEAVERVVLMSLQAVAAHKVTHKITLPITCTVTRADSSTWAQVPPIATHRLLCNHCLVRKESQTYRPWPPE